jgi:hypothetical protein
MPKAAVLIGIDNYATNPLSGCEADAMALADILARNADRSANFQNKLVLAAKGPVLKAQVAKAAEDIFSTKDAEVLLFYFAGHGAYTKAGGFLVTQDATEHDMGVPMTQIIAAANGSTSSEKLSSWTAVTPARSTSCSPLQ